ncbi:GNAT family N-acetyltransferase [Jatrophihabitans telluris]|uniref:GNAT family N-acetyltransferase n=1 Tax=Jatrophihabitans telluris TaxID=2038343 RepID=A0ABY4QU89_9ACTN|nr:GNAT family N-acetyltransferase [Jatrophihabitans telluris]UQX87214.1 GNAT family N-acetyltransferase [Jatrophihabitans telluris]
MTRQAPESAPEFDYVVVDIGHEHLPAVVSEAMAIYVAAMGYQPGVGKQRAAHVLRHSEFAEFRFRAAINGHGRLIGFAYGYTSVPGQWWHDLVRKAVGRSGTSWLEHAFELSELHVSPASQGQGTGEQILRSLAADLPHRTMVLSTPEGDNRAWRLYRRLGFVDLARNHLFPGDHRPFGVLGAELPLAGRD